MSIDAVNDNRHASSGAIYHGAAMTEKTGPASLRLIISLLLIMLSTLFAGVLLTIFFNTMPQMLLQSENKYLIQQLDMVNGLLASAQRDTTLLTLDTALWPESYAFVTGGNPDFIEKNWPEASLLESYRRNFVIYKNLDGEDVYSDFHDYIQGRKLSAPPGFSDYLSGLTASLRRQFAERAHTAPVAPVGSPSAATQNTETAPGQPSATQDAQTATGAFAADYAYMPISGIISFNGEWYNISASAIMPSHQESGSGGVLIMGDILNNEYFQDVTHSKNNFEIISDSKEILASNSSFHFLDDSTVSSDLPLLALDGSLITLRMTDQRIIFSEGQRIIRTAFCLLVASMLIFGILLYQLTLRRLVRPIEKLSRQIAATGSAETPKQVRLDLDKFSSNREFAILSSSINDMLDRLDQSNISMDVFRNILDGLDSQIYVTDPFTDEILFVNSHAREYYNIGEDAIGEKCWKIMKSGSSRCRACPKAQLLDNPDSVIVWNTWHSRTQRWFRNTNALIDWPGKGQVHLQCSSDITQIHQAEQMLQERLERQKLLAAISQSFISTENTEVLIPEALRMSGEHLRCDQVGVFRLAPQEQALLPAFHWLRTGHSKEAAPVTPVPFRPGYPEYDAFISRKAPYLTCAPDEHIEDYVSAHKHGLLSFISVPIYSNGEFWGMLAYGHTEKARVWTDDDRQLILLISGVISVAVTRGHMEDRLLRMSAVVDSSPQFIAYVNPGGSFESFNQGALDLLGYSAAELESGGLALIFDDQTYSLMRGELIPRIIYTGESEYELPMRCKDGGQLIMAVSAFKIETRDQGVGLGIIATDITKQRELERELISARDQAEQSSRAKGDFLSRMSHEMRTPMNAIIGMTSIAKNSRDAEKKEYCLDKIADASQHLLGVINDILDMSKIEANKFELSNSEFNFEKMLMRVVNVINFRVEEKKLTLLVKPDKNIPDYIIADEQRLAQVIANLLSNAVKFTPENGVITLEAQMLGVENGLHNLQISVTDTGIGIDPDQQRRLFHSFEQADGSISRKFGGTGLGLSISRSIVELMGGKIWVKSQLAQGSTFAFAIAVEKGQTVRRNVRTNIDWKKLRVLVVDDAPEVLEYFGNFAETLGLNCTMATDGFEAEKLLTGQGPGAFDMVFVDWQMPGMDGIELTRRIKRLIDDSMVVIMISATQWNEIEIEATEAGVDKFIPKPLFPSLIVNCINECLNLVRNPALAVQPDPKGLADKAGQEDKAHGVGGLADSAAFQPGCFSAYKILLAEDIPINSEIVLSLLEDTGIRIDCAQNGQEAFDMFCADPAAYDLILMDIHMPEVDGYEATKRIRSIRAIDTASIPIVAMTANVFREDVERCLAAGMDDHIGKPINLDDLLRKLRKYLPKSKKTARAGLL